MHQYPGQLRDSVPSTKSRPRHCSRVHVSFFLQVTGSIHSQSGLSPGFWLFLQNWKVGPSGFDPSQWFLMFPYFILVSNENLLCHELDLPVTFGQGSAGSNSLLQGRPLKLPVPGSWSHWLSSGEEHQQPECRGHPESARSPAGRFWAAHHRHHSAKSPVKTEVPTTRPWPAGGPLQVLDPECSADIELFRVWVWVQTDLASLVMTHSFSLESCTPQVFVVS